MGHAETSVIDQNPRRKFLQVVGLTGAVVAAAGLSSPAFAAKEPNQPEADSGHDYTMPDPNAKTERDFRMGVIGPAVLSRMTSEIAVDKATNPMAKEFANFELREAIGVLTVLKTLKTPMPPMDDKSKATLEKIKSAEGNEFDKAYIQAQLENHEFLRDLANVYLKNSAGATSVPEMHGRNYATLTLGVFKEHVVHTKEILKQL